MSSKDYTKKLDLRGSLDVLRNGFVDYGVSFQMAYFQPASGLNPDAVDLYNKNNLKVYRQIFYPKTMVQDYTIP